MIRHSAVITFLIALALFSSGMLAARTIAQRRAAAVPPSVVHMVAAGGTEAGQSSVRFFPDTVTLQRGDTVTWQFHGTHNVHFRPTGVTTISLTPTIGDGARYQGGDANSGVRVASDSTTESMLFSLVIDLEPGLYPYLCDLHPGMRGMIEVTGSGVDIAST